MTPEDGPRSTLAGRAAIGFAVASVGTWFLPDLVLSLPSAATHDGRVNQTLAELGSVLLQFAGTPLFACLALFCAALAMRAGARLHARIALALVGAVVVGVLLTQLTLRDELPGPPPEREPRIDPRCTRAALAGELMPRGCAERGVPDDE